MCKINNCNVKDWILNGFSTYPSTYTLFSISQPLCEVQISACKSVYFPSCRGWITNYGRLTSWMGRKSTIGSVFDEGDHLKWMKKFMTCTFMYTCTYVPISPHPYVIWIFFDFILCFAYFLSKCDNAQEWEGLTKSKWKSKARHGRICFWAAHVRFGKIFMEWSHLSKYMYMSNLIHKFETDLISTELAFVTRGSIMLYTSDVQVNSQQ